MCNILSLIHVIYYPCFVALWPRTIHRFCSKEVRVNPCLLSSNKSRPHLSTCVDIYIYSIGLHTERHSLLIVHATLCNLFLYMYICRKSGTCESDKEGKKSKPGIKSIIKLVSGCMQIEMPYLILYSSTNMYIPAVPRLLSSILHTATYVHIHEWYAFMLGCSISPSFPLSSSLPSSSPLVPLRNSLWPVPTVYWHHCSPPSWCCPPPLDTCPWKPDNCFHQPGFNPDFSQPDKWNCKLLGLQLPTTPKLYS